MHIEVMNGGAAPSEAGPLQGVPYQTICRRLDFARLGLLRAVTPDDRRGAMFEIEKCKAELSRRGYVVPKA